MPQRPSTTNHYDYALSCLRPWLEFRARHVDIPGFSVTIRANRRTIFSQTYGVADIETGVPLRADHLFNVASQSKMFTAVAVMLLAQNSKLRLDDPAVRFLPWLKKHDDQRVLQISIRQLLSHSAGLLRDGVRADHWQGDMPYPTAATLQQMILGSQLALDPNTALKYSNLGYALLGEIVERASGQPFTAFITSEILKPLQLSSTFADFDGALAHRAVAGHSHAFEQRQIPLRHTRTANSFASVIGAYSTTEDMARFMDIHLADGLLTAESWHEMQRLQARMDHGYDYGMEFGLGLEIHHPATGRVVGHSGHASGVMTATYADIPRQLTVSVAANAKDAPIHQMAFGILSFLDSLKAPTNQNATKFNAILCNSYSTVGVFANGDEFVAIDPDDWQPFGYYDTLALHGEHALRFTTEGSVYQTGESIRYSFSKEGRIRSARLAGSLLWPEETFRTKGYRP